MQIMRRPFWLKSEQVQNAGIVMYVVYSVIVQLQLLCSLITCQLAQRLTRVAAAMLGGTTTGNIGRVEGITLESIARLLPAFVYHVLDDVHVDGCSEDGLQLLLGGFAQDTLAALVGEEYLEG